MRRSSVPCRRAIESAFDCWVGIRHKHATVLGPMSTEESGVCLPEVISEIQQVQRPTEPRIPELDLKRRDQAEALIEIDHTDVGGFPTCRGHCASSNTYQPTSLTTWNAAAGRIPWPNTRCPGRRPTLSTPAKSIGPTGPAHPVSLCVVDSVLTDPTGPTDFIRCSGITY